MLHLITVVKSTGGSSIGGKGVGCVLDHHKRTECVKKWMD